MTKQPAPRWLPPAWTKPRTFGLVGWTSVGVLVVCLVLLGLSAPGSGSVVAGSQTGDRPVPAQLPELPNPLLSRPVPACILYDDNLDVEPGKIISVQVNILEGACGSKEELAAEQAIKTITPGKTSRENVVIGSKVKVSFLAPLYDADVSPVVDSVHTFDGTNTRGEWAWRFRPNQAGDLALPLRLTLYDDSGEHVVSEVEIVNTHMHVPFTIAYVASSTWTGIIAFFTSLQGLIASIAGAAAGTAGFRAWTVKKARKEEPLTSVPVTAAMTNGYL